MDMMYCILFECHLGPVLGRILCPSFGANYPIELPPRVQKKLDESHENLAKLERALDERERIMEPLPPPPGSEELPQSAYMLHLIRENERLKKGQRGAQGGTQ